MKFLKDLIFFFGTILIYLHVYIHFKISSLNEFSEIKYNSVNDLSKQKIMTTIYYKLPFVFDGTNILKSFDIKDIKRDSKKKESEIKIKNIKPIKNKYQKTYETMPLLEPSVRFFTKNTVYELKKNKKIDIHHNLECRNFYLIHTGKVVIYCIHPKYKKQINDKEFDIEKLTDVLQVELYPNSILFVPNYWYVYVKSLEKSIVEKVQYKTILNEVNFLYDTYLDKYFCV